MDVSTHASVPPRRRQLPFSYSPHRIRACLAGRWRSRRGGKKQDGGCVLDTRRFDLPSARHARNFSLFGTMRSAAPQMFRSRKLRRFESKCDPVAKTKTRKSKTWDDPWYFSRVSAYADWTRVICSFQGASEVREVGCFYLCRLRWVHSLRRAVEGLNRHGHGARTITHTHTAKDKNGNGRGGTLAMPLMKMFM